MLDPTRWADGGQTNRDGIMICPQHHVRVHDPTYTTAQLPSRTSGFHRRTGV